MCFYTATTELCWPRYACDFLECSTYFVVDEAYFGGCGFS
jgi:hypothetical protein